MDPQPQTWIGRARNGFTKGDRVRTLLWVFVLLLGINVGVAVNNAYGSPMDVSSTGLGALLLAAWSSLLTAIHPGKADRNGEKGSQTDGLGP